MKHDKFLSPASSDRHSLSTAIAQYEKNPTSTPPPLTHPPVASALWSTFLRPVFVANINSLRCRVSDISTVNLTVAFLSDACSLLIKLGSFD